MSTEIAESNVKKWMIVAFGILFGIIVAWVTFEAKLMSNVITTFANANRDSVFLKNSGGLLFVLFLASFMFTGGNKLQFYGLDLFKIATFAILVGTGSTIVYLVRLQEMSGNTIIIFQIGLILTLLYWISFSISDISFRIAVNRWGMPESFMMQWGWYLFYFIVLSLLLIVMSALIAFFWKETTFSPFLNYSTMFVLMICIWPAYVKIKQDAFVMNNYEDRLFIFVFTKTFAFSLVAGVLFMLMIKY
ncbi:MAG: hypothetical protein GY793_00305 [Proteobacteria bacterium]|nr:hypothetical protein [Pseudomonadota bacterium]